MSGFLTRGNAAPGINPLAHFSFLDRSPERVLALRLALSRVIRPNSVVLDAGCGSLGLLAILAAKLGAARVIGVDLGSLELARALAEENGVAGRVEFIQSDLDKVEFDRAKFDVIVAMIYNNEPRRDLHQQRLKSALLQRFGHSGTVVVPNKVRYTVAAYNAGARDRTGWTQHGEWDARVDNVERQAGISFRAVRQLVGKRSVPEPVDGPTLGQRLRRGLGWLLGPAEGVEKPDRAPRMLLTGRQVFTEIDYSARLAQLDYPETVSLEVTQRGEVNLAVFQQDLLFDDLLIRTTRSPSKVCRPQPVEAGDVVVLSTGRQWKRCIPVSVKRPGGS